MRSAAAIAPRRLPRRGPDLSFRYVGQRLLSMLVAVWGAASLVFLLIMATGSPAVLMAGPQADKAQIERLSALYGFDQPLAVQYALFMKNVVTGNLPPSLRFDISPLAVIGPAVPYTLTLAVLALMFGTLIGLAVGYLSVNARSWWVRELPLAAATVVQSVPVFIVGLLLVLFYSLRLGWLPTGGTGSARHAVLPVVTLALLVAPPIARLFRTSLQQQQNADHVRTAMAKQISLRAVRVRHMAVNALVPVVALLGMQTGSLIGGAVLTESVFGWPGLGTTMVTAVGMKDYPVIVVAVMLIAVAVSACNFLADIAIMLLDPRTARHR